jgi:hypothetical protein
VVSEYNSLVAEPREKPVIMKEKKSKKSTIKVTPSSGNIFADMGLANP